MYYGMSSEALKRLYVEGSLENQDDGFAFQLKNLVDSGSVSGITKLTVDGEERSLDGVTVELGGKVRPVSRPLVVVFPLRVLRGHPEDLRSGPT